MYSGTSKCKLATTNSRILRVRMLGVRASASPIILETQGDKQGVTHLRESAFRGVLCMQCLTPIFPSVVLLRGADPSFLEVEDCYSCARRVLLLYICFLRPLLPFLPPRWLQMGLSLVVTALLKST